MTTVTLNTHLTQGQAESLAYFLKKVAWSEMRVCTKNEQQAYEALTALSAVQNELTLKGYSAE
jgi:hypothetical protein